MGDFKANSAEFADAIARSGEINRVYNVRKSADGLAIRAGTIGFHEGPLILQREESVRVDGLLTTKEALDARGYHNPEPVSHNVVAPSKLYDITLTVPTDAQDANDVIAATQEMTGCARVPGGTGILQSVTLIDADDQGAAIDLFIFDANVALGTEDAAISITDANLRNCLCVINIASTDYKDCINNQVADVSGLGRIVKAGAGTRSLWIAANSPDGGTWASGEIRVRLGFLWD